MSRSENSLDLFYKNSTVLVTGGNGFLGKVLVQTLLNSFDVKKIYLLIRVKKNEVPEKRIQIMLSDKLFDNLRGKDENILTKVEAIVTDYDADDITSQKDHDKLVNEVNVVFNVLATIKFNEPLHDAVNINMLNTQKIVKIVRAIKNLKSFVHVSTLFSNSNREEADEIIYDHPLSYQQIIAISDVSKKTEKADKVKLSFQHDFPNTYTLTKHFAEKLVIDQAGHLPTGIFRPPIVISSYKNVPGWTDNLNNLMGITTLFAKGFGHCWLGRGENSSMSAPVDYCINALIASAWDVAIKFEVAKNQNDKFSNPIYNYIFSEYTPTCGTVWDLIPLGFHSPLSDSIYYYSFTRTSSSTLHLLMHFVFSTLPAFLLDRLALLRNKKVKYMRISDLSKTLISITSYFVLTSFSFKGNKNVVELLRKLRSSKNFREDLDFDMKSIDWNEYYTNFVPGIKNYYFKENLDNVEAEAKGYLRKKYLHLTLKYCIYAVLIVLAFIFLEHLSSKLIAVQSPIAST